MTASAHPDRAFPALRRRGFLAAGAAAGLGALALTGCGGGAEDAGATGGDGKPRRGGQLRAAFAGGGAAETFDPHLSNLFSDAARAKALYDKLADCGSDMSAKPRLAASWEPGPRLDRWKVTLREATFHDGRPVTAADVLYSYRRIADPRRTFLAKASLEPIDLKASRALDARTVEFLLKRPTAEFPKSSPRSARTSYPATPSGSTGRSAPAPSASSPSPPAARAPLRPLLGRRPLPGRAGVRHRERGVRADQRAARRAGRVRARTQPRHRARPREAGARSPS